QNNGGICLCILWSEYGAAGIPRRRCRVIIPGRPLSSSVQQNLQTSSGATCSSVQQCAHHFFSLALASLLWAPGCDSLWLHGRVPTAHARETLHFVNGPVVFWDLSCVPEDYGEEGGRTTLWKWEWVPVKFRHLLPKGPQSLVISCTMSAVSDHLLYYVRSLCHLL
ncbi:unnamed protein product, partial [Staurois parvus]